MASRKQTLFFSGVLARRVLLDFPSKKRFPFFGHKKRFKTYVSEIVWLFLSSLFYGFLQAKIDILARLLRLQ